MSIEERLDILYQICEYITNSLKRLDSFEKNGLKDTIIYKKEILHLKKLINEQNRLLFLLNRAGYKYNKEDFIKDVALILPVLDSVMFLKQVPHI